MHPRCFQESKVNACEAEQALLHERHSKSPETVTSSWNPGTDCQEVVKYGMNWNGTAPLKTKHLPSWTATPVLATQRQGLILDSKIISTGGWESAFRLLGRRKMGCCLQGQVWCCMGQGDCVEKSRTLLLEARSSDGNCQARSQVITGINKCPRMATPMSWERQAYNCLPPLALSPVHLPWNQRGLSHGTHCLAGRLTSELHNGLRSPDPQMKPRNFLPFRCVTICFQPCARPHWGHPRDAISRSRVSSVSLSVIKKAFKRFSKCLCQK